MTILPTLNPFLLEPKRVLRFQPRGAKVPPAEGDVLARGPALEVFCVLGLGAS